MSNYAKIENGIIVHKGQLPKSNKTTGRFDLQSDEELRQVIDGVYYLPIEEVNVDCNNRTHVRTGSTEEILSDKVIITQQIREKTVEELATQLSNDFMNLRAERTKRLSETDYLALSDNTMTEDMTTYRQELRDLPATYADNPQDVVYPDKPEE